MIWLVDPAWYLFIAVLVLWLPQNLVHEGSHAIAAVACGAKITRLWPFPGRMPDGKWAFAYVLWKWDGTPGDADRADVALAPQIVNSIIVLLLILMEGWFPFMPNWLVALLVGFTITNYIDGAVNLSTFYRNEPAEEDKHTDGWVFQKYSRLNVSLARAVVVTWQLLFGFFILCPESLP